MKLKLFPLSLVAFPSKLIPLHIFEDRYKRMISSCIDEKKDFGIIYQNTKTQSKIGCSVSVEKIFNKYPDGRMDILVRGRKIFKVQKQAFLDDLAIGDITFMPDLKPLDKYMKLMLAAGFKYNLDHHLSKTLTFELLEMIQTSHDFELELLRLDSEKKRADFLDQFFSSILKQSKLFNSDKGYQS
jgi:Lon protease-like protein